VARCHFELLEPGIRHIAPKYKLYPFTGYVRQPVSFGYPKVINVSERKVRVLQSGDRVKVQLTAIDLSQDAPPRQSE
jgi:hypothetical protein